MSAAYAIGDLAAAVLPHLADDHTVGFLGPDRLVEPRDKIVRQFVRHIQPPAVRARPQPPADDAVLPGEDILSVIWIVFLYSGE